MDGGKMRVALHLAILLFTLGLASNGVVAGNVLDKQELIEKSGIERQVKEIPGSMQLAIQQARQQGAPIDDKFAHAWAETVPAAYSAEKILSFIDKGLQKLLIAKDERFLLAHYNSPLGRRITELEIEGSRPEAATEMQAYAQKLMANSSEHADRLALYQKIDKAVGAMTMAVELAMHMQLAVQVGMVSAPRDEAPVQLFEFQNRVV